MNNTHINTAVYAQKVELNQTKRGHCRRGCYCPAAQWQGAGGFIDKLLKA